jgi:hypothetical protein
MYVQQVAVQCRGVILYRLLHMLVTASHLVLLLMVPSLVIVRFSLRQQIVRGGRSYHHASKSRWEG